MFPSPPSAISCRPPSRFSARVPRDQSLPLRYSLVIGDNRVLVVLPSAVIVSCAVCPVFGSSLIILAAPPPRPAGASYSTTTSFVASPVGRANGLGVMGKALGPRTLVRY